MTIDIAYINELREAYEQILERPKYGWRVFEVKQRVHYHRYVARGIGVTCRRDSDGVWHARTMQGNVVYSCDHALSESTGDTRAESAMQAIIQLIKI